MRISRRAWFILILAGCAGCLSYLDRHTLSVLKSTLVSQHGWTEGDYAWLVNMFQACYTTFYLFTGRWVDRWGTRKTLPLFVGIMAIASVGCGLSPGLRPLGVFRAVLGAGQAGIMPAVLVAIYHYFPPERRATAAAGKDVIYFIGQVLATPLVVWSTQRWTGSSAFVLEGLMGFAIALAWFAADDAPPAATRTDMPARPALIATFRSLLADPAFRRILFARMISDPAWFFYVYWEPSYIQDQLGISFSGLARIGWIPTAAATSAILIAGTWADRRVSRDGWAPARTRRRIIGTVTWFAAALFLLPWIRHPAMTLLLLAVARSMMAVWLAFSNLLAADLVPSSQTGTAVALISACGSAMGIIGSYGAARLLAYGYAPIFVLMGCLYPIAAVVLLWPRRPQKEIAGPDWARL